MKYKLIPNIELKRLLGKCCNLKASDLENQFNILPSVLTAAANLGGTARFGAISKYIADHHPKAKTAKVLPSTKRPAYEQIIRNLRSNKVLNRPEFREWVTPCPGGIVLTEKAWSCFQQVEA